MAVFELGKPIITKDPRVIADAGLKPGAYRFQLVVEDSAGHRSAPDEVVVIVQQPQ